MIIVYYDFEKSWKSMDKKLIIVHVDCILHLALLHKDRYHYYVYGSFDTLL